MKSGARVLVSLCIGAVFSNAATAQSDAHAACDRDYMVGIANDYTAALVSHMPNKLPVAPGVKFTENLVPLQFGEQGLWKTVTGRRDFDIYAADVDTGNVVWIGIVKENEKAVMMAARLKVVGHRITELETLVGPKPRPPGYVDTSQVRFNLAHLADRPWTDPCEEDTSACVVPFPYSNNERMTRTANVSAVIAPAASMTTSIREGDRATDLMRRAQRLENEQEVLNLQGNL
jgi:hypothetical protein